MRQPPRVMGGLRFSFGEATPTTAATAAAAAAAAAKEGSSSKAGTRRMANTACFKQDKAYLAAAAVAPPQKAESAEDCQAMCVKTVFCEHFSYWPTGTCFLVGLADNAWDNIGAVSGPKSCDGLPASSLEETTMAPPEFSTLALPTAAPSVIEVPASTSKHLDWTDILEAGLSTTSLITPAQSTVEDDGWMGWFTGGGTNIFVAIGLVLALAVGLAFLAVRYQAQQNEDYEDEDDNNEEDWYDEEKPPSPSKQKSNRKAREVMEAPLMDVEKPGKRGKKGSKSALAPQNPAFRRPSDVSSVGFGPTSILPIDPVDDDYEFPPKQKPGQMKQSGALYERSPSRPTIGLQPPQGLSVPAAPVTSGFNAFGGNSPSRFPTGGGFGGGGGSSAAPIGNPLPPPPGYGGSMLNMGYGGGSSAVPLGGGSMAAPIGGGSMAVPMGGSSMAVPMGGGSMAVPMGGGSMAAPMGGGSMAVPLGGSSVAPVGGLSMPGSAILAPSPWSPTGASGSAAMGSYRQASDHEATKKHSL
eukprot:CAMPEP_0206582134 /NCGR_PEP_ID=MMETSP0325_2-20121206/34286_1 /ASSEMBLY_ACC=CAM_ASM_000347 /TAXON_ID=2866 /ORGANISM="Crypthecodinium cohnii, Strain Seligo" /LENGTH=525 /DNA_ID=CAMNT_0054088723 /DNA_START=44 /DNA_END=1619 /DNA_ORIENTATION=-